MQTVLGAIGVDELGMTLMHEHTVRSPPELPYRGVREFSPNLRHAPVTAENAWLVREDPYASLNNRALVELEVVAEELARFTEAGGRTIVDNSNGPERDPALMVRLAETTGLNLVMGSGWSVTRGTEASTQGDDVERYVDLLIAEHTEGVALPDGRTVRPGVIGEIGVGPEFTGAELLGLRAAAIAQTALGVPLMIHLPGWRRLAHRVLDEVFEAGVDPRAVVLCHMDPSGVDPAYQLSVAERGAWLEFDMIGMPNNYPGEGQSPSVGQTVEAVAALVSAGYARQLLLSHDVGMKTMWTRYGGNGYGFVPSAFLPRLVEAGVDLAVTESLLVDNPRALFEAADRSVG
ncbi:phosphotriesterase family protein [Herbiconiux sp. YIM B11900]|uniref:phosphotriesterase family protein n=1 Tax=Herbiconiux sp. YIM B11900 TaxID=3404131 RepID=UPI003F857E71